MAFTDFTSDLILAYNGFLSLLSPFFQTFFNLFFLALMIFLYATFVWKLHRFISKKNILDLDLNRYNTAEHPTNAKVVAGALYFLEYAIILPFLIFFWFYPGHFQEFFPGFRKARDFFFGFPVPN